MRTRLSPDASKMLICTTSGYLIIIHDLKLSALATDLRGFKVINSFNQKLLFLFSLIILVKEFSLNLLILKFYWKISA